MELLDSKGRLFGTINIIDALVVLFVVAVGIAGLALVAPGGQETGGDRTTTYATLDLGTQPDAVATAIAEGDNYAPSDQSNLTVTDVALTPAAGGTHVRLRVKLTAPASEASDATVTYDGAPPRLGRSLTVSTPTYNATGIIRAVGNESALPTTESSAVIRTTVPAETARTLSNGTELRKHGRTVATVRDVYVYENGSADRRHVVLVADVNSYRQNTQNWFGETPLRRGASISLPVGDDTVDGRLLSLDSDASLGRETRNVLITETLDARDARAVSAGDTYTVAGRDIGTVESVTTYGTDDPDQKRVYIGLSLQTLTINEDPFFAGTTLREGATVPIRTPAYDISGSIDRLNATTQRGTEQTRTVTLQMRNRRPVQADALRTGMVERSNGETVAQITDVKREPAQVVLTTQDGEIFSRDHPINQDVRLTAELSVRETPSGTRFKGATIQPGSTVTFDLDGLTVQAEVVSL